MDKLKDIWNEKKKLILTITIGVVVFILIIVLIILLVKIFTRYDYASTEKMMVSATTEYLKTNKDLLPTDDMSTITVMYDTLVGGKYIKEMSKVSKDSSCTGSVDVYKNNNKYYLKDRLGFNFRVVPNSIETVTLICNSKTLSVSTKDLPVNFVRLDILDESINEINEAVAKAYNREKLEGLQYTNGNLYREV